MFGKFGKSAKYLSLLAALVLLACEGGGSGSGFNIEAGVFGPNVSGTPDSFRGAGIVNDAQFLIGGPLAQGKTGDILLQNDKIRVILQKPTRNTGVGLFGGNILDADRFRPKSEPGQDQFGTVFPLVNLSWTVNYQRLEIVNADFSGGPVVVRATGVLDVYDYIQTNIIVPFAKVFSGVDLVYSPRFDDVFNPFKNVPELRGLNPVIVTEYSLKSDADYVIIETRFQNDGEVPVQMPVGDWVNGSGTLEPFVPKKGFVRTPQIEPAAALIYQGMQDNVGVSYGYFYNPVQFLKEDGTIHPSTSLTVSGVTPMVLGESLLSVLPLNSGEPKINFKIEPGSRTITRYFAVGKGDVASVLDAGFSALGVAKLRMSGKVIDSNGQPVAQARVVVLDSGDPEPDNHFPATVAMSGPDGTFSADLSSGNDVKDRVFGSGNYTLLVYKEGYVFAGGPRAGKCSGGTVDAAAKTITGIECALGQSGTLSVTASEGGSSIPARVTIVGFEPSPLHAMPLPASGVNGIYGDINLQDRPYGIVDLLYLDPSGAFSPAGHHRLLGGNQIRIEPGEYEVYVTRGPEYSVFRQRVTISAGGNADVNAELTKVLDTTGYVGADFHLHGVKSADSAWSLESRVKASLAEGMDILVSSDHDYVTDYAPVIEQLGYSGWVTSMAGDELTALAFGHLGVFPLTPDPNSTTGGAYDYTYVPSTDDLPGPDKDMVQTMDQIVEGVDAANPGTQVFTINHILDKATGNFAIVGLVTSTLFDEVSPLSTYADPVNFRMPANSNEGGGFQGPFPMGTSGLFTSNFTALELTIGAYPDTLDHLMQTALPTWFNMLNLGLLATATTNSDSHTQVREPMGTPRNYVLASVDPRDGVGSSYQAIDKEEIAVNVNAHRSIASNGIFIRANLKSAENPGGVTVGGTVVGGSVTLELEIQSNEFFDWDRVDIFANTVPIPAKDDLSGLTDLSAEAFHHTSHTPKYLTTPLFQFARGGAGDAALNQTVAGGLRKATLTRDFNFSEDTWIVVVARGSNGVRSLFPYVTKGANTSVPQATFLDTLDSNPVLVGGIRPFAFTNPLFVDVDGNGFQAKFIRNGQSPLAE